MRGCDSHLARRVHTDKTRLEEGEDIPRLILKKRRLTCAYTQARCQGKPASVTLDDRSGIFRSNSWACRWNRMCTCSFHYFCTFSLSFVSYLSLFCCYLLLNELCVFIFRLFYCIWLIIKLLCKIVFCFEIICGRIYTRILLNNILFSQEIQV